MGTIVFLPQPSQNPSRGGSTPFPPPGPAQGISPRGKDGSCYKRAHNEGQQQLLCMQRDCSGVLPPLPSTAVSPAAATIPEYVTLPPALGGGCDLLCAPLAQEGLVHSLKEINYFCYLKKNPLGLVSLTFKLSSTCTLQ